MSKQFSIKHVQITNWTAGSDPQKIGQEYWNFVSEHPNEPLIEATIQLVLSSNEYQSLLKKDRED